MNKINLLLLAIMSLFIVGCGSQTMTGDSYSWPTNSNAPPSVKS